MSDGALRRLVEGDRALVVAGLLAPGAWVVHLSAALVLVPVACETGWELPLHALTVACAAVAAAGLLLLRRTPPGDEPELRRWAGSLAVFFLALIVVEGIPALVLDPCW